MGKHIPFLQTQLAAIALGYGRADLSTKACYNRAPSAEGCVNSVAALRQQKGPILAQEGLLQRVVLPLLILRPYRCEDCDARFFGAHSAPTRIRLSV